MFSAVSCGRTAISYVGQQCLSAGQGMLSCTNHQPQFWKRRTLMKCSSSRILYTLLHLLVVSILKTFFIHLAIWTVDTFVLLIIIGGCYPDKQLACGANEFGCIVKPRRTCRGRFPVKHRQGIYRVLATHNSQIPSRGIVPCGQVKTQTTFRSCGPLSINLMTT